MPEIVVAGHLCLDIIPAFLGPAEIVPGRLIEVGPARLATGGCVSNVGRALCRLGVDVRLIGKVGDDAFGSVVRTLLQEQSPDLTGGLVTCRGGTTSYTVVISPPGRDRTFLHMPGENDTFGAADLSTSELDGAKMLHFGYPPLMARMFADEGAELAALLARAKEAGVVVSLDMSLPDPNTPSGQAPWRRILERVLPFVDIFFPSDAELAFMLGGSATDPAALADECIRLGAAVVVLKRGDEGLLATTSGSERLKGIFAESDDWCNRRISHRCFDVLVAGTTGAGDATIAGFLMGFVRGFDMERCAEAACAVGACCVEASDAFSGIRGWEETEARVRAGWDLRA